MTVRRNAGGVLVCVCFAMTIVARVHASSCMINPGAPASGHPVTVIYDPAGGPLAGATSVYIHKGINGWAYVDSPDLSMTLSNGVWTITYLVPQMTYQLDCVFNDGAGTWDNNSWNDWHFNVPLPSVGAPPSLPANASRAHVMMQGFFWNVPGNWYNTLASKAKNVRYMRGGQGIDRIWFPPPSKSPYWTSMGYDLYDYYDIGQFNQGGNTSTRFGTQTALKNTITAYKALGVVTMADIILNHRSGGELESNPNTGGTTYTDFGSVSSGKCTWHYNQFHPSTYQEYDEGAFGGFPDVCHVAGYGPGSPYYDLIEWGNWLTNSANAGFDGGWRFDYPKGIHPSYIADFRKGTGNAFGILEYWDGNISLIENYVKYSGNSLAFDFPAFYTMIDVFNYNQHIGRLIDSSRVYAAKDPARAVPFVANHDTDKDEFVEDIADKMLAYAYILTYQGYPCIFWRDYFDYGLAGLGGQEGNGIDPLVWVRGALGGGRPDIQLLKVDSNDLIIYGTQSGSFSAPGYIIAINNHDTLSLGGTVTTANTFLHGKELQCHAWYSYVSGRNVQPVNVTCGAGGLVTIQAPPRGYAVYSIVTDLPSPWLSEDVGSVVLPGSADYYSDTFTVSGSGQDIGGTNDDFQYVYQVPSGECGLQARVLDMSDTDSPSKAGVMIRKDAISDTMNAAVLVTPDDGVVFQWRDADEGTTSSVSLPGVEAPCWVRLVRSGNDFRGYCSADGTLWTQIGSARTLDLPASSHAGLAVTGGDNTRAVIARLDQVSVNTAPILDSIADQIVSAGSTLTLTNSASDPDDPAQSLSFSLANPPTGAAINLTNGIFSWRPLIEQSPSTQTVSVVVSDDGIPGLSTTNSFDVSVLQPAMPAMSSATLSNGMFGFWIDGDTGPDYSVLWTTNLVGEGWTEIYTTNAPVLPFHWSMPVSGLPREYFKLELGP